MFEQYKEAVAADEKTVAKYIRTVACKVYTSDDKDFGFYNPLFETLSVPNEVARDERAKKLLRKVEDWFKTPKSSLHASMAAHFSKHPRVQMSYSECIGKRYGYFSQEAKAMFVLMYKIYSDQTTLGIGHLHKIGKITFAAIDPSLMEAFQKSFGELQDQVITGMNNLVEADDISFAEILKFLLKEDDGSGKLKTQNGTDTNEHYRELLQVAKYTVAPLRVKMTEFARVRDMKDVFLKAIDSIYGRSEAGSFINYYPASLYCKFGNGKDNQTCDNAMTSFTTSGFGHSFNTDSFFQV